MRNHNEKARDMSRSVLPSTSRKGARDDRALIHRGERARVRRELHALRSTGDPDDFDGDLTWEDRSAGYWMVDRRREADKIAPLMRWAERVVAANPRLAEGSADDREVYFRRLLPPGVIGNHALFHLHRIIDPDSRWAAWRRTSAPVVDKAKLHALVAKGACDELNRRLRELPPEVERRKVWQPDTFYSIKESARGGVMVPGYFYWEVDPLPVRLLLDANDIDAFAAESKPAAIPIIDALYRDLHSEVGSH